MQRVSHVLCNFLEEKNAVGAPGGNCIKIGLPGKLILIPSDAICLAPEREKRPHSPVPAIQPVCPYPALNLLRPLVEYFQENRSSGKPFLLVRISFPGRPIFIQFVNSSLNGKVPLSLSRQQIDLPLIGHVHTGLPDHELLPLRVELGLQLLGLGRRGPQRGRPPRGGVAPQSDDDHPLQPRPGWQFNMIIKSPKGQTRYKRCRLYTKQACVTQKCSKYDQNKQSDWSDFIG